MVAKFRDNPLRIWLTEYQKGNFHFVPSSTVEQTLEARLIHRRLGLIKVNIWGKLRV